MRALLARDERQSSVDRAGDRLAYIVVSYGVLAVAAYRSLADGQASWDLVAIVIVGGLAGWGYRAANRVIDRRSLILVAVTIVVALSVAIAGTLIVAR